MPKIPDDIVKRVQDAADIVKVVGESVRLRKAGVNYTGLCPFHEDRHTGNFIVTPKGSRKHGNQYHCFVCGAHGNSLDFLQKHDGLTFPDAVRYLGRMTCIEVDNVPVNYTPPPPPPPPPKLPRLEIPREWVSGLLRRGTWNNFIAWLYTLPWGDKERARLPETLWQYCVAGWKRDWVMFWQIDHEGIVRSGKMMMYDDNGHRRKEQENHPKWIYNQPGHYDAQGQYIPGPKDILKPEEHDTDIKPLFGAHLLRRYPDATVNVVESEKTALIMANYFGEPERSLWVAVGGLRFLKLDAMQPLIDQQRTVWLWPDRDGIKEWENLREKLGSDKIQIYTTFFDRCYIPEEDGPKADVADIAIRLMSGGRVPVRSEELRVKSEEFATATPTAQANSQLSTLNSQLKETPAPTPDHEQPADMLPEEWREHKAIMQAIKEWQLEHAEDEPFLDPEELRDPRVREWREKIRHTYNYNKRNNEHKAKG